MYSFFELSLLLNYVLLFLQKLLTLLQFELIKLFLHHLLFFLQQIVILSQLIHFFNFYLQSIFQCVYTILQRNIHLTVSSFFLLCFPPFLLYQIFLIFLSQKPQLLFSFLMFNLYILIEKSHLFYLFIFLFQLYSYGRLCFTCDCTELLIQLSNVIILLQCQPGQPDGLFGQNSDFTFQLIVLLSELFNDFLSSGSFLQLLFQLLDL